MDAIAEAFKSVPRVDFVPEWLKDHVNVDTALPIGAGQTISQPSTVRMMLEWLGAQPRDKVLDVGSGSGWTSALLSNIIGSKGKVFAVERIPKLLEQGRENCKKVGALNVQFFQAGKSLDALQYAILRKLLYLRLAILSKWDDASQNGIWISWLYPACP